MRFFMNFLIEMLLIGESLSENLEILPRKSYAESGIGKYISIQARYASDFTSVSPLSTSSTNSSSSTSSSSSSSMIEAAAHRTPLEQKLLASKESTSRMMMERETAVKTPTPPIRFYVRSLGWVKISEEDLTSDRSSRAVNKCINDLSRGTKDFNDVVARWGDVISSSLFIFLLKEPLNLSFLFFRQGKDLYMDLDDCNLVLIDPIDDKVLNTQPITSIRVWGVGRDNSR